MLNNLIKPRDFIFFGLASIPIFLIESYNENFINFLTSTHSATIAGFTGLLLSKANDLTIIKYLNKKKPLKKLKKLNRRVNKEIAKTDITDEKKKIYLDLNKDITTAIEFYNEQLVNESELDERFKRQLDKYENEIRA